MIWKWSKITLEIGSQNNYRKDLVAT